MALLYLGTSYFDGTDYNDFLVSVEGNLRIANLALDQTQDTRCSTQRGPRYISRVAWR